mmetsp:Transcript_43848/g.107647  ORF Transcript_43848/g.107647 Transcript_43848/m.107647 type:complete len:155 (+) Transcript_43848:200-664(+)
MSDDEFIGRRGGDDVALPKATVYKFANEMAASMDVRLAAETRELLVECCTEFVQMLSSEANEICEKDKKKTIAPEHILRALNNLGLSKYHAEVAGEHEKHKDTEKSKLKGGWAKMAKSGISTEELLRQQQELFNMAKNDPMAAMAAGNAEPKAE